MVDAESTADREIADPYVVAMALELLAGNPGRVLVPTDDVVDRLPAKLSINPREY